MRRKPYFPSRIAERGPWFGNFGTQLPLANALLDQDPAVVAARVADAKYCEFACGAWLTWARENGTQATAAIDELLDEAGDVPYALPVFTPPALPAGVVAVPPGALRRIQDFVAMLKRSPQYTDVIGQQLKIIGDEDAAEHLVPEFTLETERGGGCECVKVRFKKHGHKGVVVFCRRGNGDWEMLGIDLVSPYDDERPMLNPLQPEVREYRLQFYDDDGPNGSFSPVQRVTVSP